MVLVGAAGTAALAVAVGGVAEFAVARSVATAPSAVCLVATAATFHAGVSVAQC